MNDLDAAISVAATGMNAQALRLRHVSENLANADTPGYRRKIVTFRPEGAGQTEGGVRPGRVRLDPAPGERIHDPSHPLAGENGFYEGSNVDAVIEIADAREAQRGYDANLNMMERAMQMKRDLIGLLRG